MHTLLAIAARPHPSARHQHVHVPETHHNAAVSADRYTPTDLVTRPLEARPYEMSVCHERHHQVRMREWILDGTVTVHSTDFTGCQRP